ncbi:hypothetical protein K432DRAFT_415621 [Lepidopterella palustris CBS 459.81]|uniref:Uncharacterized protein n=1 Tax=Lepidopterella palustris CBS 459.81 TaxID=1314670 RepID=A0A8E2EDK7_9PEZI|nr:hypothetical protein K432DRAFT_415621 [Lepidopterella palustris CBS 459.81]
MIETLKDMKHSGSSYNTPNLERTASQILHHMEDKDSENMLESCRQRVLSNARTIYGPSRALDIVTFAGASSRKIGAAIVEHNSTGRTYVHCSSAKESSRLAAIDHLLIITEDILQRMFDAQGIESSGWLPLSAPGAVAASAMGNAMGSAIGSRRGSVQPVEVYAKGFTISVPVPYPTPRNASDIQQSLPLGRTSSDLMYVAQVVPRTNSEVIQQPKPLPIGRQGGPRKTMQWNLGSEG